jgi:gluconate 2-dehydrogenase alpha chain
MLYSKIGIPYDPATGKGAVGRNYCYQVGAAPVTVFFEDKHINPFMASGAQATVIDDFNGDNFDHAGLAFVGGAWISAGGTNGRPIQTRPVPSGTPRWGREWKQATAKWYNHAFSIGGSCANYAHRQNYLDLDPTYRDALGRPLLRMTYNFRENDFRLAEYITRVLGEIGRAMRPTLINAPAYRRGNFSVIPYQTTHNTGGTIMGSDPGSSVVNRYLQSWNADNLFVVGASAFPQNQSYNPTGTVGALSYWAAEAIINRYLKRPGPLVHA